MHSTTLMNEPVIQNSQPSSVLDLLNMLKEQGVSKEDYALHVDRYLESKARQRFIPLHGTLELTPLCNLDCKMCYVHLSATQLDGCNLLPASIWKRLIDKAHEMGMMNANLSGGECLTYPDFDEVYLYLRSRGIRIGVLTNGVLLTNERCEFFKRYPPKTIQVTLYGASEEEYESVTGKRAYQIVVDNLIRLREMSIPTKVSLTPNAYMNDDYNALLETVEAIGLPYNINANLIKPREETGRIAHDVSVDRYVSIYQARSERNGVKLIEMNLADLPVEGSSGSVQQGLPCGAGRSSFCLKYNGAMCPCASLGEIEVNALEVGFSGAWRIMNEAVLNYQMPEECGSCVYTDRCIKCAAMHKNAPQKGHCDPRICERTKKLVAAGFIPMPDVHEAYTT